MKNNLKLTKETLSLLKIMIEVLFPLYTYTICIHRGIVILKNRKDGIQTSIHWYQFVMTDLSELIFFNQPYKRDSMDNYLEFARNTSIFYSEGDSKSIRSVHPIKYLYSRTSWNG